MANTIKIEIECPDCERKLPPVSSDGKGVDIYYRKCRGCHADVEIKVAPKTTGTNITTRIVGRWM